MQTKYITEKLLREDLLPIRELICSYLDGSGGESFAQAIPQFRTIPAKQQILDKIVRYSRKYGSALAHMADCARYVTKYQKERGCTIVFNNEPQVTLDQ